MTTEDIDSILSDLVLAIRKKKPDLYAWSEVSPLISGAIAKLEAHQKRMVEAAEKHGMEMAFNILVFQLSGKAEMVNRDSLINYIKREQAGLNGGQYA